MRYFPLPAIFAMLALIATTSVAHSSERLPWSNARQLVLVVTSDWNADRGTLRTFTHDAKGWHAVEAGFPVRIGRAGSAWGIGLHSVQSGPAKHEGDGRSPAGVFTLGTAFGYADAETTALPYAAMSAEDWCVDVEGSPLYNRIVNTNQVGIAAVAGSSEPMRRDLHADGDLRYKLGFVIKHNPHGKIGAGSCIFAHLWKSPADATAGCTAMPEPAMRGLLGWLQPDANPIFVLLPRHEYRRLRAVWNLPESSNP